MIDLTPVAYALLTFLILSGILWLRAVALRRR